MISIIKELAIMHNFSLIPFEGRRTPYSKIRQKKLIVDVVMKTPKPAIYYSHFFFVDFNEFGVEKPVYFNMIRDPIDRFVSYYYFRRFGDMQYVNKNRNHSWIIPDEMSINDCIIERREECTNDNILSETINYFCGQHPECGHPTITALQRAKTNVINEYLVVGMTEKFTDLVRVLERLLPKFFDGASHIWLKIKETKLNDYKTSRKANLTLKARELLLKDLSLEYDFYNFVVSRFNALKQRLNL